jgi:hypothetical protein
MFMLDENTMRKLLEVKNGLHGDGSILTPDARRDLANLLSLAVTEIVPVEENANRPFATP